MKASARCLHCPQEDVHTKLQRALEVKRQQDEENKRLAAERKKLEEASAQQAVRGAPGPCL